jgi:hypothetical protein
MMCRLVSFKSVDITPAFAPNYVKPGGSFKMSLTVIKNEY